MPKKAKTTKSVKNKVYPSESTKAEDEEQETTQSNDKINKK